MSRAQIARCLSVLGHPLVFLPLAAWMALSTRTSGGQALPLALALFALLAVGVMAYSWLQVRSGRWGHVDASLPGERRSLNGVLLAALSVSALVAWFQPPYARGLALGLTLSCVLVGSALIAARWLKVSLHAMFVVFASTILWQVSMAVVAGSLVFAAAVAWSRLELGRHSLPEVLIGAGLGLLAGAAFWFVVLQAWS